MNMALWGALIVFTLVFILKVPIALGMLASGFTYLALSGANLGIAVTNMLNVYYTNYTIIAVPLFIFTANVMNTGKITEMLFSFCDTIVGRFRGGLGHVNIMASLVFSGMTGSAIADASGLGIMEIDAMKKAGYDDEFSCAITATSACIGPIFPPSILMLIYSMLTGASVGALFMGGVVPGVLLAIFLMAYVAFISNKRQYPYGKRYTLRQFATVTVKTLPALLVPVILLGGIYGGVMTPTEAGAIAGLYALVVSCIIYRVIGWKELKDVMIETAVATGKISIIVGAASCLQYIVAREKIPQILGGFLVTSIHNKFLFLLCVNIFFLILGMFLESTTIMIIFTPLLLPVVQNFGIDLVHLGLVLTFNIMIGLCTPPYGSLLFITSAISGAPLKGIIKEIIPIIGVMIIVLLILTYIPDVVLFLPKLFLRYGA